MDWFEFRTRAYEIDRSSADCATKLSGLQDALRNCDDNIRSFFEVGKIIEGCATSEHQECLSTLSVMVEEVDYFTQSDLREPLKTVGQEDIDAVSRFVSDELAATDRVDVLALLIPYLYRGNEQELANRLPQWRRENEVFFQISMQEILSQYNQDQNRRGNGDLKAEIRTLLNGLEQLARQEGLRPKQAYRGANSLLIKAHRLVDDIRFRDRTSYDKVKQNINDYPHLHRFLSERERWQKHLQDQNRHTLAELLSHPTSRSNFEIHNRNREHIDTDTIELKRSLRCIRILSYYDHCFEMIDPTEQGTSELRESILQRDQFDTACAEVEVYNALRREFRFDNVTIDPPIETDGDEKVLDARISSDKADIVVEITSPQSTQNAELGDVYSVSPTEGENPVRGYVTKKIEKQLSHVKRATDDLTMLVIENEPSRVDDWTTKGYVYGPESVVVPADGGVDDLEDSMRIERGDPILDADPITQDLDILVNYSTAGWKYEPYLKGQVFDLSGDIPQNLLRRIGHAFNAGTDVFHR